jgi:hypothetical protein
MEQRLNSNHLPPHSHPNTASSSGTANLYVNINYVSDINIDRVQGGTKDVADSPIIKSNLTINNPSLNITTTMNNANNN